MELQEESGETNRLLEEVQISDVKHHVSLITETIIAESLVRVMFWAPIQAQLDKIEFQMKSPHYFLIFRQSDRNGTQSCSNSAQKLFDDPIRQGSIDSIDFLIKKFSQNSCRGHFKDDQQSDYFCLLSQLPAVSRFKTLSIFAY